MASSPHSLAEIQRRIDEVKRFLSVTLCIANAHTVEFYTHDVWSRFVAVPYQDVLESVSSFSDQQRAPEHSAKAPSATVFGFCSDTNRLTDTGELLRAAKAHSLPGLGVCLSRDELLQTLGEGGEDTGAEMEPDEFMNAKKSHEVRYMSEVVACLALRCGVKQVIDVGSGKGYLSSFLSLQYGLQVYGIDSSSTNTHGAQERNRRLRKYSRAYREHGRAARARGGAARPPRAEPSEAGPGVGGERDAWCGGGTGGVSQEEADEEEEVVEEEEEEEEASISDADSERSPETEGLFLSALSVDAMRPAPHRAPPGGLSAEERERRKRENLERKARDGAEGDAAFSPLTSYVTADTELRRLIHGLQDAVVVGLHTCGDLAPSTLRMFVAKPELAAVCSVGCCYHLLSEEFDPAGHAHLQGACGFPLSRHLRERPWFCGRNARMSACLALERVSVGQGIQMESLFFRAVFHVILRDHYDSFRSEKRVGKVYAKAASFVDYVRRALRKLELDESKLSDGDIRRYHDEYRPRMGEMRAFNMLKVALAPCIEGLILLDRLCYLKEQGDPWFSALVQLFDPLLSPRCYAVVGLKSGGGLGAASGGRSCAAATAVAPQE